MSPHISTDDWLDYVHGVTPKTKRGELERHLAGCSQCRAELAEWQGLSSRLATHMNPDDGPSVPTKSIGEILEGAGSLRPTFMRRRVAFRLAAAALALVILASPFFSPFSARVLAQVPGVGDLFSAVAIERGLAVAYQAGLISELNRSETIGDLTFTVVGAYADSTQTAVIARLRGPGPRLESLWSEVSKADSRWKLNLSDSFGRAYGNFSWSAEYDAKAGEVRILFQTRPLPILVGHLRVHMLLKTASLSGDWAISFPVQRVSDKMTREVAVDQTFTSAEGIPIHLDKLVFSPSRTVLHYHYTDPAGDRPDPKIPEWSLSADGRTLARLGGGGGGGGGAAGSPLTFTGTAAFEPAKVGAVTIRFDGFSGGHQLGWRLPLREGSTISSEGFSLRVDRLAVEDGRTVVTATVGGGDLKLDGISLLTADGPAVSVEVRSYLPSEDGRGGQYTLIAAGTVDPATATLEVARGFGVKPESQSTTVEIPQ